MDKLCGVVYVIPIIDDSNSKNDDLALVDENGSNNLKLWSLAIDELLRVNKSDVLYLYSKYCERVGKSLSYPHVVCGILVKVNLGKLVDCHMYCSEGHGSIWLLSSALSLFFLLILDILRSPDDVPLF